MKEVHTVEHWYQCKFHFVCFLQCIADCIQASVSGCLCSNSLSVKGRCYLCRNASIFLLEMHFIDTIWFYNILKCRFKQIKDFIWMEFFMTVIGNSFCCIPHSFTHLRWQVQAVFCFQDIANSTFTRLTVDTNNICIVISSNISRIDRQIWYRPAIRIFFISPVHSFCNCILVRS